MIDSTTLGDQSQSNAPTPRPQTGVRFFVSVDPQTKKKILINLNNISRIEVTEGHVIFVDLMGSSTKMSVKSYRYSTIVTSETDVWAAIYHLGEQKVDPNHPVPPSGSSPL